MKTFKRIIIMTICLIVFLAVTFYEIASIIRKEQERQTEVFLTSKSTIDLNLDMVKIAVQTNNIETYAKNLANIKNETAKIKSLNLVIDDNQEYLNKLNEYSTLLEEKLKTLNDLTNLKSKVSSLETTLKEKYNNPDDITRDIIKSAKDDISNLKISADAFSTERITSMTNSINELLDGFTDKAGALADCIDECYKNRIGELTDELAELFKSFSDKAPTLNSDYEKEFSFDKMTELKNY